MACRCATWRKRWACEVATDVVRETRPARERFGAASGLAIAAARGRVRGCATRRWAARATPDPARDLPSQRWEGLQSDLPALPRGRRPGSARSDVARHLGAVPRRAGSLA